ncbi:penicillin-binding transpeptidase domain-containing protein [Actinoplanes sp. NPDC004185]
MPPRADGTPRRGQEPRRGASADLPPADGSGREDDRARGFGGIGDARAYTPRGRTVREGDQRTRSPRTGRNTDPFRPALQVLDGGRPARDRRREAEDDQEPPSHPAREKPGRESRARAKQDRDTQDGEPEGRRTRDRRTRDRELPDQRAEKLTREPRGRATEDRATDGRAAQSRGTQSRAAQGRAAESRAAQSRAAQSRAAQSRAAQDPYDEDEWDEAPRRGGRATAGATRSRSTANPRRGAAGARTEASARTGRERKVAVPPGPRRGPAGRPARSSAPARPGARRPAPLIPAEPPRLANGTRRLRLGTVLALTLFVAIGVRLVVLQVGGSTAAAESLLEQRQKRLTEVVLPAPRGSILDSSGAVLAHSVEARYIYADPEMIKDPVAAAGKLSPKLGIPPSKLISLMAKKKRPGGGASRFEYLARGVDIAVADEIAAMKIPGISSDRDERRDIPGADLAANLIGFTGDDHTGLEGLEARYDELLRGSDGKRVFEIGRGDLAKEIPGGYHRQDDASPGSSIQLTINRDLQFEVQRVLSQQGEKSNATVAAAVVLNARTGEVLAQASYPAYNAAKPGDFKPRDREDVATSVIADPGSTHKAFTIGAALEEGVITRDSLITVGPGLKRGGYDFVDTHRQPAGTRLTIPGVLAYSSNVGTIRIADKLGKAKLYEYQQRFGLGRATNEGMPGEATGKLLAPDEWSGSASGSVPIGMSVDATLIQMTAGYGAIANDGTYIQPHLIKATISGKDGSVVAAPAPETHRVISAGTARQLREMMESVVDAEGGTGGRAKVDGYRVAGKTGTGKMLVEGQYTKHNAGSFIGMAPAENPQFVIGVFADVPDGTGGDVAAPAFSKMMSSALRHYRVPPSGNPEPTFTLKG